MEGDGFPVSPGQKKDNRQEFLVEHGDKLARRSRQEDPEGVAAAQDEARGSAVAVGHDLGAIRYLGLDVKGVRR